jgi:enolase
MFIKEVRPSVIKNSRGERTIQVTIKTYKGKFVSSAPSGKSTGAHEVSAYARRGIGESLKILMMVAEKIQHKNFMIKRFEQLKDLENEILKVEADNGPIGANARYALQTAFLKAAAFENGKELWEFVKGDEKTKVTMPMPVGNCIGGGLHSEGKRPDFQEFLLIPSERTFSKATTKNIHAYHAAKAMIKKADKEWKAAKNDESAWQVQLANEDVLEILFQVAKDFDLKIGLDIAASSFFSNKVYNYENKKIIRERHEQVDYIQRLIEKYHLFYIEDPMQEEDFIGFGDLNKDSAKGNYLVVGDDLTTTNLQRVKRAIVNNSINAMIIKPNQIGNLLEVAEVVKLCRKEKIRMIFSHRSGETMDTALADYAVGFGADFVKMGIMGKERLVKHRRLMEIEKSFSR